MSSRIRFRKCFGFIFRRKKKNSSQNKSKKAQISFLKPLNFKPTRIKDVIQYCIDLFVLVKIYI